MDTKLLASLEDAIDEWANKTCEKLSDAWSKSTANHETYYSEKASKLMAQAAASVFDAMVDGQVYMKEQEGEN